MLRATIADRDGFAARMLPTSLSGRRAGALPVRYRPSIENVARDWGHVAKRQLGSVRKGIIHGRITTNSPITYGERGEFAVFG
jgi:hypothetical protein